MLGLHESGTFDAKEKLWTRSLALRRGGTVVVEGGSVQVKGAPVNIDGGVVNVKGSEINLN